MFKYYNILSIKYPAFLPLFFFGILVLFVSCEAEDDIPPPTAYVEPEPEPITGDCQFEIVVPVLADGLDFECSGPEITTFGENGGSVVVEPVENPSTEGINNSEGVMLVEQSAGVANFAGFFFDLSEKVDFSEKQTIRIKVFSPAAGEDVNLKLEDSADGSISSEVVATTTVANEWEELSFSFSSNDSDKFDRMVLFFNFLGNKDAASIHYFDDIELVEGGDTGGGGPIAVPTVAAPTPSFDENIVISLFSDAYTDVPVDTWRTEWSNAVLLDTMIADNPVKKYSELNFVGVETVNNQIDISAMTNFHVNIWTANATEITIQLVDFGPDGAFDGGDDTSDEVVIENPTQQEWITADLSLADFPDLVTRNNFAQLLFIGQPSGSNTIFVDNVYFYDGTNVVTEPATAAPAPTLPEADVISVYSDAYTNIGGVNTNPDWNQATSVTNETVQGDNVLLLSGLNYQGIDFANNMQDVSGKTMIHFDIWSEESVTFNFSLISDGPLEIPVSITSEAATWNSVDIALSEYSSVVDLTKIIQFKFDDAGSGNAPSFYVDNIYFY